MYDDLDRCIDIIRKLLVEDKRVIFTNKDYLEFKDKITLFVYDNNLDKTDEWANILHNMISKSTEYLSVAEANNILINLESLKRVCLKNASDEKIFEQQIHPLILKICKTKFFNGHYADAVESAFKEINSRCKKIYMAIKNEEKDGADLMNNLFSPNNPILKFEDINSKSGADVQLGYMQIFSGSIIAIRNPNAHENNNMTKDDAYKRLVLASLLMDKIDEAVKFSGIIEQ